MKYKWIAGLSLLVTLTIAAPAWGVGDQAFAWPKGQKAAVSLAYDDALDSQLDNAIPALDNAGLKGSFYLTLANDPLRERLPEWRAAAANGHELGNHTLFHQCVGSMKGHEWVPTERDLDKTSAAQMKDQVQLANTLLYAIDGKRERTMTVPCGDVMAQGQNYIDLVKNEFVAIKLGFGAVTPDMATLDPYAVTVDTPEGVTGQQLIEKAEEAARLGTMVNFTFHGIGGDHLAVSKEAHEELLAYLSRHQDIYWVATFIDIMQYVKAQQALAKGVP